MADNPRFLRAPRERDRGEGAVVLVGHKGLCLTGPCSPLRRQSCSGDCVLFCFCVTEDGRAPTRTPLMRRRWRLGPVTDVGG